MSEPLPNTGLIGEFDLCDKDIIQGLNKNFSILDRIVQLTIQDFVDDEASLPASPVEGQSYIQEDTNAIRTWNGTEWLMYPAVQGFEGYIVAEDTYYYFNGTEWTKSGGVVEIPENEIPFGDVGGEGLTSSPELKHDETATEVTVYSTNKDLKLKSENENLILDAGIDNHIDVTNHNIKNVSDPIDELDAVNKQYLDDVVASMNSSLPIGAIIEWTSNTVPLGMLLCDGSAVSRTEYSELFNAIGTTFGPGDSFTTFNLPNRQGVVGRGAGTQVVNGRAKYGGLLGQVIEDQMQRTTGSFNPLSNPEANPAHMNFDHSTATGAFTKTQAGQTRKQSGLTANNYSSVGSFDFDSAGSPNARVSTTTDGETRASSLALNYVIKAKYLNLAGATESAIDELNVRISSLESKFAVRKVLISSITATGTSEISDLAVTGLTIGKTYKVDHVLRVNQTNAPTLDQFIETNCNQDIGNNVSTRFNYSYLKYRNIILTETITISDIFTATSENLYFFKNSNDTRFYLENNTRCLVTQLD